MEGADCAAACLTMVLGYLGCDVTLEEAREAVGAGRGGASAYDLVTAAARFGARGRGVQLDVVDLPLLARGAILHWGFDHFVVFDRLARGGVRVVDPAVGPRLISMPRFSERFTGVAVIVEPGVGFTPRRLRPHHVASYLGRVLRHRGVVIQVLVLSILLQAFALAFPLILGAVVDRVVPWRDVGLVGVLAIGAAGLVVFQTLAILLRGFLLIHLRTVLDVDLTFGFMERLADLPYSFFTSRPAGDLLSRYESNRALRTALTSVSLSSLLDGALVVSYVILLFAVNGRLGMLVVLLGLAQLAVFAGFRRPMRDLAAQELEASSRTQSHIVDMLSGFESLKALGAERRATERWSHLFVDEMNVALERGRVGSFAGALTAALTIGSPLAILLAGTVLVLRDEVSLGTMLTLNALAAGFLTPLSSLLATALQLQETRGHIARIEDVLQAPREQDASSVRKAPPLTGTIALEEVTFRYGRGDPPAVNGVTLAVAPGEKIAVVGRSGAGKSTLARLLVGLYPPESGRILFDGIDLQELDLRTVRAQVGVVTQDARIFGTSVRANIALADPDASLDDVVAAARLAAIHEDIDALPMGYDTLLGDGGSTLSGGQRQRLALARALLRKPAILLLDEATSDLDNLTERIVADNLAQLRCTRIVIAHRLSTVIDADSIVVLERGAIVETGPHAALLAKNGIYADLVRAQQESG
jgi:ABC-type bacteriocin/lantibiotic exporter with double-glycine peptidase domain